MHAFIYSHDLDAWAQHRFRHYRRAKYKIEIPLPPRIDPSVTMMTVEEKPDVTYVSACRAHRL